MHELDELRKQIDDIDRNIIECIVKRQQISAQIGLVKASNHLAVFDPKREEWLKHYHLELSKKHGLPNELITQLFDIIIEFSRKKQYKS